MDYCDLGTTGMTVSRLGLGMAALGRPGYITLGHDDDLAGRTDSSALERRSHEMLDTAHAAGINYLDVARSYGRAEEFLGKWLDSHEFPKSKLIVGSKWGYIYSADWKVDAEVHEMKVHTRANLDRQYAESTRLVGSHLRIYQVHSATHESNVLENPEVLDGLAGLRDQGMVMGVSTSGPDQARTIRRALEIEVDGRLLFGTVQATWNLLETSAGEALADAADAGLGVIVKEAVANGRLTPRQHDIADLLRTVAPEWSPDALAIAAGLHQPWSSVVLSGAATTDQLASNLQALDVPPAVTDQLPPLAEVPDEYWATRGGLAWN